jgi:hypothetical protein
MVSPRRREPLHEQVRVDVSAEEELAWSVELPGHHDLRRPWFGDEVRAGHYGFLSVGLLPDGLLPAFAGTRMRRV